MVWWSWTPRGSSLSGLGSALEMASGVIRVVAEPEAEPVDELAMGAPVAGSKAGTVRASVLT